MYKQPKSVPPPGFRPEDRVPNARPDTKDVIERSFNKKAQLAFDEILRLRQRRPGGR